MPQKETPMANEALPMPVEAHMVRLLRARVEEAVRMNGAAWAADKLQLSIPGVEGLMWSTHWSVSEAVRFAGLLDVLTISDLDRLAGSEQAG